ncbi:DUF6191 domain-containing protein [Nocardia sp. NPDC056541]|uniref:DUF6191 domain-containing protein n=1 Tax=Nocardia sp. NPDC056541 TaxID=3345860 RepID=UPI00366C5A03
MGLLMAMTIPGLACLLILLAFEFEQRRSTLMHREDPSEGAPPRDRVDLAGGSARLVARER